MNLDDYRAFCLDCARELAPAYHEDLEKCVRTQLAGGRGRLKNDKLIDVNAIVSGGEKVARLLIDLIGVYIAWRKLPLPKRKAKRQATFVSAADAHIEDLGREDQRMARRLSKDLNAWLKKRGDEH